MGSPGLETRRGGHTAVLEIGPSARSGWRGDDGGVGAVWSEGRRWWRWRYRTSDVRLGWPPGGSGAAGSDRSGGEDEAT